MANQGTATIKHLSQFCKADIFRGEQISYFKDLRCGEFAVPVSVALKSLIVAPAFTHHIGGIFSSRSEKKMIGVAAGAIVTFMAHKLILSYISIRQDIGYSVSVLGLIITNTKSSIPLVRFRGFPFPTIITFTNIHFIPKLFPYGILQPRKFTFAGIATASLLNTVRTKLITAKGAILNNKHKNTSLLVRQGKVQRGIIRVLSTCYNQVDSWALGCLPHPNALLLYQILGNYSRQRC